MYLIVGLGNPGAEYKDTRHNVGFMAVDALTQSWELSKKGTKFKSVLYEGFYGNEKVLVAKPQTYMNLSGNAVQRLLSFYKIPFDRLIVIYDDIDIPFGMIRARPKGSAGTHNGMRSVVSVLADQGFSRIRIGVGRIPDGMDLVRYVLSNFTSEEKKELAFVIDRSIIAVQRILTEGNISGDF